MLARKDIRACIYVMWMRRIEGGMRKIEKDNSINAKSCGSIFRRTVLFACLFVMIISLCACSETGGRGSNKEDGASNEKTDDRITIDEKKVSPSEEDIDNEDDFDNSVIAFEKIEDEDDIDSNETEEAPVIQIEDEGDAVIYERSVTEEVEEEIYDPEGKVYSIKAASEDMTTLGFVGDVGFQEGYAVMSSLYSRGKGIAGCLSPDVLETMNAVDIMMINNEFPYSNRGTPTAGKTYTFRAKPENASFLHDMGVDIVSLANNHAYDYGPDALIDTIDILNAEKVPFVGAGKNIDEACKPAYIHVNGHVIAYVSATQIERYGNPDTKEATADSPGVLRTLDSTRFVEVIKEAEANSDFVVVYVHWGTESTDLVEDSQRALANDFASAGADLIIGDHSHCLQGIDYVSGVPVFYSLGNFLFNSKTLDTCIVKATLDRDCKICELKFIPCVQSGCSTYVADAAKASSILTYLQGISDYATVSEEGIISESDTYHNIQNGMNTSPAKKVPTPDPLLTVDPLTLVEALPPADVSSTGEQ